MTSTPLVVFSKGEIAPALHARIDIGQYQASLKRARNVIVQRYGGVAARTGFRFIGELDSSEDPAELIPFQYSIDQAYMLGFQQAIARPLAFGGFVLEENQKILSITNEAQAVLEIEYHGMVVGDRMYLDGITGMTGLNRRFVTVLEVPNANHVRIDANTALMPAFVSSTGTQRATPAPAPTPTPTPSPTPTPPPPPETGGGGGTGGGLCVTEDAMILMADGSEKPAGEVRVGDYVRTFHEHTWEAGDFRVIYAEKAWSDDIWNVDGLRATGNHLTRRAGKWVQHHDIEGAIREAEGATIVKLTVQDAHTYLSNGVLSHNIKDRQYE